MSLVLMMALLDRASKTVFAFLFTASLIAVLRAE